MHGSFKQAATSRAKQTVTPGTPAAVGLGVGVPVVVGATCGDPEGVRTGVGLVDAGATDGLVEAGTAVGLVDAGCVVGVVDTGASVGWDVSGRNFEAVLRERCVPFRIPVVNKPFMTIC